MTRTVVIIHPGALGDVLLAVPAMQRLRARFPQHRLFLIAGEQVAQLLTTCGVIDEWSSIEGSASPDLFDGSGFLSEKIQNWFRGCDCAVMWAQDEEGTLAAALAAHGAHDVRVLSPFSSSLCATHQRDRFLETLGESPAEPSIDCRLKLPDYLLKQGQARLLEAGVQPGQAAALFHPGSGSIHKCVRPEVLVGVMERLEPEDVKPIILEGPADWTIVANVLKHASIELTVLRDLDLGTLAGVLAHMRLFVGHDSGVTHLSALLNVPTVALFGPTDPGRWAPFGRHVVVVKGAACSCFDWQSISHCLEKPCLGVPVDDLLNLCRSRLPTRAHP